MEQTTSIKRITNKLFLYSSEDKSLNYEVEFTQGFPLKPTYLGKTYAKKTQCVIRCNGFLVATNSVTKHAKDPDNVKYAYMNAFNPIKKEIYKEARIKITNQILFYCDSQNN